MTDSVYDFDAQTIKGQSISLESFKGKTLLIVNTASRCGYTKQYTGLENLYKKYKSQDFYVLGFPCNQFGGQEPGVEDEIQEFCTLNFGVTFPLFAKIEVNGSHTHPLYAYLKEQAPGLLGTQAIKWNFTKFLVDKHGQVVKRYAPGDTPEEIDQELLGHINAP